MARNANVADAVAEEAAPDAEVKPNHQGAGRSERREDRRRPASELDVRFSRRGTAKRVAEAQNKAVRSADSK